MRQQIRLSRPVIYAAALVSAGAIVVTAICDHRQSLESAAVEARQLFGLWALGLMLASIIAGPLVSVLPWLPLKSQLIYGRRAIGLSAFAFAALHVLCYLISPLKRGWRELYTPGPLWITGLGLGVLAMSGMSALSFTSTDAAVKRMGGRRWKRLHRTVYVLLLLIWAHALCVGSDFGINRAPDVSAPPDAGALIGFSIVSLCWVALFILRSRGVRWRPRLHN